MNETLLAPPPVEEPVLFKNGQVKCGCPYCACEAIDDHFDPDEGITMRCTSCGREWLIGTEHELVIEPSSPTVTAGEAITVERDLIGIMNELLGVVQSQRRQLAILDLRMSRVELQVGRIRR